MLLAITWLASNWWSVSVQTNSGAWAHLSDGRIAAGPPAPGGIEGDPSIDVSRRPASGTMRWTFDWSEGTAQRWMAVPIWAPLGFSAFIAVAYRRRKPAAVYR